MGHVDQVVSVLKSIHEAHVGMTSSQRSDTVVHAGITHASSAETSPASAILTPSSDIPAVTRRRLFAPSDIFKYQLLGQETPTTTRIWAQTECWRISSSPPASGLLVEVHASGECQRALQHLEKDVINEDRER
ncbi:hypothetical protein PC122_g14954 [Phytophthora cactorum]|nr:hypothetical protein PC122_g14954 [Phytophthora cactorum]